MLVSRIDLFVTASMPNTETFLPLERPPTLIVNAAISVAGNRILKVAMPDEVGTEVEVPVSISVADAIDEEDEVDEDEHF